MGATETQLSVSQRATAEAFTRDQMLLRAIYKAQRVMHDGRPCFIQQMQAGLSGGDVETTVYLTGSPIPIPASEITLAKEPQ
ncbi:hypothetical protein [Rugamonas aquatica]|uniref:Uncharacterized protein n=1 Tax=Rugamonas aquatica TaxID=2743357 RepID=A0A6A7N1Q7_9BURK|nr:hypothetical protein [Rugamonas aquatica]MQA38999.1 hypothetical protein [Rugamonas aquatica]